VKTDLALQGSLGISDIEREPRLVEMVLADANVKTCIRCPKLSNSIYVIARLSGIAIQLLD
jgi:hypothetical protein